MKISIERFDAWALSVWGDQEDFTPSRVAKIAGISKSSLFFNRRKGELEANVVLQLARGLNLNPLDEITKFDEFAFLEKRIEPSIVEVLSQVSPETLMEAILCRLNHEETMEPLEPTPITGGLKRWLDAVGMHGKYGELAKQLELSIGALSVKISENRLDLGQLATLCALGKLNGRFALVVTGHLTWEEAGFSRAAREVALRESSGKVLVEALWSARSWLEKLLQVKDLERGVFKNFG